MNLRDRLRRLVRELWAQIWWESRIAYIALKARRERFLQIPTVRSTRSILSTFCAEAAVLIAVFPYLEFLIASRNAKDSGSGGLIDMRAAGRRSAILSVGLLVVSVVLAIKTSEKDDKE